ncbi:MAG: DUF4270 domain-containing protein [Muribaculaceae bacterium]|nr:DUF4270 domain-containing protein [Muribaculaceae bacterium]
MKFRSLHILPLLAALILAFSACEDSASPVGPSIVDDTVDIVIDSSFTVSGNVVRVQSIAPRTTIQMLGTLDIPGYGRLSSNVVTQFIPSVELDTANFGPADIDSIYLDLVYARGAFMGDSIAPMGLTVYPLNKLLPNDITSAFNPEGYYDKTPLASKTYNTSTLGMTATEQAATYRSIGIKLPLSLGRYLFQSFLDDPANYANGQVFSENVFPGVYLSNSFGSGRMTMVTATGLSFFFTTYETDSLDTDTTIVEQRYMLVTPEVISNNDMTLTLDPALEKQINDGTTIAISPGCTELEFRFPLPEVIDAYRKQGGKQNVLNGLSLRLPADTLETGLGIAAPPYMLMVLKKDRDAFFAQNKLTDNKTSFYAQYDETEGQYAFTNLRQYMMDMLEKEEITEDDYTFSLVPVQVDFEQSVSTDYYYGTTTNIESTIQPYFLSPAVATIHFDKAKVKLTMSHLGYDK